MTIWSEAVDEVVKFLTEAGKPAMANLVTRLHDSETSARRTAEHNLRACQELREKYEPRPKSEPYATWTGD